MTLMQTPDRPRKRAPSSRALATRQRVFDAAEQVFARQGFDGATIRDIASVAAEPVGTIHHHGGGKEALFHATVARRADTLSRARLDGLARLRATDEVTTCALLRVFMQPFFTLSQQDPRWRDYARLVAFVSSDDRWRTIAAACFDPTAEVFMDALQSLRPNTPRHRIAEGFVFSVSAMLALLTSQSRIKALGGSPASEAQQFAHLIQFCTAGLDAVDVPVSIRTSPMPDDGFQQSAGVTEVSASASTRKD